MDDLPPWRWFVDFDLMIDPDIAGDTFRGYRDTLATAITPDDIPHLANSLYSKNIISQDNLDRAMMIGILPSDKKVHLLDAIEARIRSNRSAFLTVLDILNSEPVFRVHAEGLWEKYHQVLQEQRPTFEDYFQKMQERRAQLEKDFVQALKERRAELENYRSHRRLLYGFDEEDGIFTAGVEKPDDSDAEESARENDEYKDSDEESADSTKSKLRKKTSILSRMRKGVRKMFGAARDMTSSFIKEALSALNLDVKIFRKYKKRFDKHTNREQVRWWFEIWGDEGALKALESKWEEVSSQNKWRLETCPVPPPQRC